MKNRKKIGAILSVLVLLTYAFFAYNGVKYNYTASVALLVIFLWSLIRIKVTKTDPNSLDFKNVEHVVIQSHKKWLVNVIEASDVNVQGQITGNILTIVVKDKEEEENDRS